MGVEYQMKECEQGCYNDKMRVPYRTQKPWGLDTVFPIGGPRPKKNVISATPTIDNYIVAHM